MDSNSQDVGDQHEMLDPGHFEDINIPHFDDFHLDQQSNSTFQGTQIGERVTNYEQVTDMSILYAQQIRCCICGLMVPPNSANTCVQCLKNQIDITEGIETSIKINHCKECNRWRMPPWKHIELESATMMSFCLRHIKGLNNKELHLADSSFIWTEPHSRRIKVKLTVQKEVLSKTIMQKTITVEFIVVNLQCDDCKQTYTPHKWKAQVQVR